MRFCENCGRIMTRNTTSGAVVFECACGNEAKGDAGDARIASQTLGASETTEMYGRLIQTAPFDPTNQLVRRACPQCGLDYMVQIRVGEAEVIVLRCKCGFEQRGAVAPQPAAPETRD